MTAVKIKVISQRRNELLKRNEVTFGVDHEGSGTPSRVEVKQKLADMLNTDVEKVYVTKYETKTGRMTAFGEARIYNSVEDARFVEPEYIILRNTPKKEKEGETA